MKITPPFLKLIVLQPPQTEIFQGIFDTIINFTLVRWLCKPLIILRRPTVNIGFSDIIIIIIMDTYIAPVSAKFDAHGA